MTLQIKVLFQGYNKFRLVTKQLLRTGKASSFFIFGSLFLNLASWGLLLWLARTEQSVVILHYNAFMGIDVIANFDEAKNYFQIFIAPLGGVAIFLMNLVITYVLCSQSEAISQLEIEEETTGSKLSLKKTPVGMKLCQDDINLLGIHLLLGGSLMLQFIIFLYTIGIIWVNR